jgi:Secretion system C-terminal sorting domain/Ig-like domain CHU_C associated
MQKQLRSLFQLLFLCGLGLSGAAQTSITTQPLNQTSVCPSTLLDVAFTVTGGFLPGNSFSVQFVKGAESVTLPANTVLVNSVTGQYTTTITLTNALTAGTYRIRMLASNPITIGSLSPTPLLIKTQPTTGPVIKAQPIGNFTSQYTFCLNDPTFPVANLVGPVPENYLVLYDIGTSMASTNQRTFTSPVISTNTVGVKTYNLRYVVIDETKGCSPVEQPGTVSFLRTEVRASPGAPSVPAPSVIYCQGQTASPLSVSITNAGANLLWYDASGKLLTGGTQTPQTTSSGTSTYQVSQSFDQCEGPKVPITVTVQTAIAAPVVAQTRIDLCRGAVAQPLSATGTNLIWTDPTGLTSTAAPVPNTLNASKTPDGDLYYVAQSAGGNCTSIRSAIRVVVQPQPTLSLVGGKNINLGTDLVLQLRFTGAGPFRYQITANTGTATITGTATKDTSLLVMPERTVVYQVTEVSGSCGIGLPGNPATATVVVLIPTIRTSPLETAIACAGGTITTNFQTTGTFNSNNVFRLQIARTNPDTAKIIYSDLSIAQQVGSSQITGILPATATAGTYLVRVVATNPRYPIIGTPSSSTLAILGQAGASLTTTTPIISDGGMAKLSVAFTGEGPWTFSYSDSSGVDLPLTIRTITTNANPHVFEVKPSRTTAYRLTSISNGCNLNTSIASRALVTVSPLLSTEPLPGLVSVYPIPATSIVTVQIDPSLLTSAATLTLVDEKGHVVLSINTQQAITQLPLSEQPAGLYVLQIMANGHKMSRRLVKQ